LNDCESNPRAADDGRSSAARGAFAPKGEIRRDAGGTERWFKACHSDFRVAFAGVADAIIFAVSVLPNGIRPLLRSEENALPFPRFPVFLEPQAV